MRGKVAKAINKRVKRESRKAWFEYVQAVRKWPFKHRLGLAWYILDIKHIFK